MAAAYTAEQLDAMARDRLDQVAGAYPEAEDVEDLASLVLADLAQVSTIRFEALVAAARRRRLLALLAVEVACPICDGHGETGSDTCPACDGEGRLSQLAAAHVLAIQEDGERALEVFTAAYEREGGICPDCEGEGRDPSDGDDCPSCNGTGRR